MNNQFNNRRYNICITQDISYIITNIIKLYPFFWNNTVVTGHSNSMWLTDRTFLQMHVTFCKYLVFR